jgi:NADH:ubiquinone oxidoreductase subunit 2 (subunit N)
MGSLEFRDLFKIANNWIPNNGINSLLTTLCAFLLFLGAVAKSAQFPLHVWLPDVMEGSEHVQSSKKKHHSLTIIMRTRNQSLCCELHAFGST